MASLTDLIGETIDEIEALHNSPIPFTHEVGEFPRELPAGEGLSIFITRSIDKKIERLAKRLFDNDHSAREKYSIDEWRKLIRNAFGEALSNIDPADKTSDKATAVLGDINSSKNKNTSTNTDRELTVGCSIFGNSDISAFNIGPVTFETREDWLTRKTLSGEISTITSRRINKLWNGNKIGKRKNNREIHIERAIVDSIGACPFVCSVNTKGLGETSYQNKSLLAARLALTSIALLWQTPSRALDGFNLLFDRKMHRKNILTFVEGKGVASSSSMSHMPHGPSLKPGEWEQILKAEKDYFVLVGDVIESFLNPAKTSKRREMLNALLQGLLWFQEGCAEAVDVMAITKYSASMDALASGRKAQGIRKLVNERLGIQDGTPIHSGGPTMKDAIDTIYSDGRSRTIHGTNNKLGFDWSDIRSLSEEFARLCFRASIDWAIQNPTQKDPLLLLKP